MRWIGYAWHAAAIWFLLSVACAPFFLLIRNARARGKRKFADEPTQRVRSLHQDTTHMYEQDAL